MVRHFGRTYTLKDIHNTLPPTLEFDTAGGGASASNILERAKPEDYWIGHDFLNGVVVQVFRKSSRAAKPRSIPVMYRASRTAGMPGEIYEIDLQKGGMRKGGPLPPQDLIPQHPGPRPTAGKCWMVLEGPWQGTYVRPIRYIQHAEQFEGPSEKTVPHWELFEVIREAGNAFADVPTDRRLLIRDDHLIVIGDNHRTVQLNKHLQDLKVTSRVEPNNPWIVQSYERT